MGSGRRGLLTLGLGNRANAPSTLSSGIGSRWARRAMENILKSVKSDKYHLEGFSNIISDFSQIQRPR